MKKLLIILTFGLMFGESSMETKLYTDIEFGNGITINLQDVIQNYESLSYIHVEIVNFNFDYSNTSPSNHCTLFGYTSASSGANGYVTETRLYPDGSYNFNNFSGNSFSISYGGTFAFSLDGANPQCYGTSGTFDMFITADFPIEDTGYMEEDFDFCLHEGYNLVSYPCDDNIAINDAVPSEISNNLSSIVGEGVAGVNVNGTWVGSLTQLQAGSGYWFKSNIDACFNYDCAEN